MPPTTPFLGSCEGTEVLVLEAEAEVAEASVVEVEGMNAQKFSSK
jgi:hypothetical protein